MREPSYGRLLPVRVCRKYGRWQFSTRFESDWADADVFSLPCSDHYFSTNSMLTDLQFELNKSLIKRTRSDRSSWCQVLCISVPTKSVCLGPPLSKVCTMHKVTEIENKQKIRCMSNRFCIIIDFRNHASKYSGPRVGLCPCVTLGLPRAMEFPVLFRILHRDSNVK